MNFTDLPLFVGEGESPKPYQIAPQKAHWTRAEDFSYAVADEKVAVLLEGKNIVKTIYVKGKLINLIIK